MVRLTTRLPVLCAAAALAAGVAACGRPAPLKPPAAPAVCAFCGAPAGHPDLLPAPPVPPDPSGAYARLVAAGADTGLRLLSFLPGGSVIAACEKNLSIGLRDAVTGKELLRYDISKGIPLLFSRNGRVLATLGFGNDLPRRVLALWESVTGKLLFCTDDFYY